MIIIDTLLIGGLRFVLDKVLAAAEAEAADDTPLRELLLEAQLRLELGELTHEAFADIERDVFARIREIKGTAQGPLTMTSATVSGADVEAYDHDR